jgi:hypothetical protein
MITVQLTCDTGKTWTTQVNATLPEATHYFMGLPFTDEDLETGSETIHYVTDVKLIGA